MAFLINESKNIAQRELVSEIYKQGNLDDLMIEDPVISQTRDQRNKEIIKALTGRKVKKPKALPQRDEKGRFKKTEEPTAPTTPGTTPGKLCQPSLQAPSYQVFPVSHFSVDS